MPGATLLSKRTRTVSSSTWPGAARDLGLDAAALTDRVTELAHTLPDAFADAAREDGITALGSDLPGRLTGRIADRAQRCVALLRTTA